MLDLRHATTEELLRVIEQLQERQERLERSKHFGCLTRNGLDEVLTGLDLAGLSCVYWDIDGLTQANDDLGKPETNRRIKEATAARDADCVTGQVFSGDEFCAFPADEDAFAFAERILRALRDRHLSATFVILRPLHYASAEEMLQAGDALCGRLKKQAGLRGVIVDVRQASKLPVDSAAVL